MSIIIFGIDYFYRWADLAQYQCPTCYHYQLMAELQELFESFTCKICFEQFSLNKRPQIICKNLHIVCLPCVNLMRRRIHHLSWYFKCPFCQTQRKFDDVHEYRHLLQIKAIAEKMKNRQPCTGTQIQQVHYHLQAAAEILKIMQVKDYDAKKKLLQKRSSFKSSAKKKSEPQLKGFLMLYERQNEKRQKKQKTEEQFKRLIKELLKNAESIDAMVQHNEKTLAYLNQKEAQLIQEDKRFKAGYENFQQIRNGYLDERKQLMVKLQYAQERMEKEVKKKNQIIFNLQQENACLKKSCWQQNQIRNNIFNEQQREQQEGSAIMKDQIPKRPQTASNKSLNKHRNLKALRSLDFLLKKQPIP